MLLLSPSQQPLEHKEQSCSKNRKKQCAPLSLELRGLVPCSEEASGPTLELKRLGGEEKGPGSPQKLKAPPPPAHSPALLTLVFEVLQDRDDGLQGDVVGQEELPGTVLLKGLPVQALNWKRQKKPSVFLSVCLPSLTHIHMVDPLTSSTPNR